LHDINANTLKSEVYGAFKKFFGSEMSLTTVDQKVHAFRRRVNGTALTVQAVKALKDRVTPHVDYLMHLVGESISSTGENGGWSMGKDMSEYLAHCFADIMGDVTFSRHWNVQRDEFNRHFVHDLPKGVAGMHLVGHSKCIIDLPL
jgi:cytochrome P450